MKRSNAQIACLILVALFMSLLSCSSGGGGDNGTAGSRKWTYMVYIGGDNNLSDAAVADLNEMETVGSSDNVAIAVQVELSPRYTAGAPSDTYRILVQQDSDPNNVSTQGDSIGNVDMANPATLKAFINWAKDTYPAEHYALVVWDHGAGWKTKKFSSPARGAVQDETSGTFMSLPDLAKGVADSGVHFDIINFDACLMAMYEVAYEFKGLTDYMVFSEQTEPGEGDPYDTILAALAANPSMSSRDLSSTIVTKYDAFYTTNDRGGTTKSAVDMSKLDALDMKLLALGTALKSDAASSGVMTTARTIRLDYAYEANHDLGDLCDYLATSAAGPAVKTAAAEVKTALTSMVIANQTNGTDMANSAGLAVYLPLASETNTADLGSYSLLASNKTSRAAASGTWGSYLETLISGAGGGTAIYKPGNFGIKIVWTNVSDQSCNADVDLYVFEPTPSGTGDLFAPWMGQTSPNGFFSADSAASGKSEEYYLANEQVLAGEYYFLVNYYADGATCTKAKVHIYLYDPASLGDSNWHEATSAPVSLDLSSPWTNQPLTSIADLNNYSDWWVPFYITKDSDMTQIVSGSNPLELNKRSQMIIQYKKGFRLF
ncbi:MAG: clostripain-related cysteine peptidase [Nitrospirae bacterium]|nr:clostripain-related cysteine peptidase [Nitrospirota bacterium]